LGTWGRRCRRDGYALVRRGDEWIRDGNVRGSKNSSCHEELAYEVDMSSAMGGEVGRGRRRRGLGQWEAVGGMPEMPTTF
jgi:hypothetical protein